MSTLQYGLNERKTFEIQITKVLGQKCRRLNVCPQVLINWSGTEIAWCCNIQEFNPNTGDDLLYKYFWCRVSLFSFKKLQMNKLNINLGQS